MAWVGMFLAIALESACYFLLGVTTGLFFSGIVWAVLLLPPLVLTEARLRHRGMIAAGVIDGIAIVWLIAVFTSSLTLMLWLECYLVLAACGFALLGTVHIFGKLFRSAPELASAITVLLALSWLTAPIWLARSMPAHPQWTGQLVRVHPLLAMNSVTRDFGFWNERPIAYQYLLTLGQDVPGSIPESIWASVLLHLLIGCAGIGLAAISRRPRERS